MFVCWLKCFGFEHNVLHFIENIIQQYCSFYLDVWINPNLWINKCIITIKIFKNNKYMEHDKEINNFPPWTNNDTFHGMLAFQHLQASLRCCRIVLALFCLIPSGIISRISCMTAARNSRSKWLSTRCLVTVLATPLEWRPSNCLARRLPSHRSSSGTIPRRKNSQTRQPGAQKPQPGPLPTAPC